MKLVLSLVALFALVVLVGCSKEEPKPAEIPAMPSTNAPAAP